MDRIIIKNSLGQDIAAVVDRPRAKTDKLAILCPGYLDTKDYAHLAALAGALCGRGYTVVRFDPTGTWESEGDISEYTMTQYLADIRSVLDHMIHEANYKQVLLGGHSLGGMVSILFAARDPRIALVAAIMPASKPIGGKGRDGWQKAGIHVSFRDMPGDVSKAREFSVPFKHVLDRDQYDVVKDARKVKAKVVFVAGELDKLVTPADVREIFDTANEPKRFILVPGIGHDYRRYPQQIELVDKLIVEALSE